MQLVTEEAAWWAAACSGDGQAFNRVFRLHRDDVYRYARRLVDTETDADDVAAAAFLELWRRREEVRLVEGSVRPWLLVTAANTARNLRRGLRRWRAVLAELPRQQAPRADPDPAQIAGERVDAQRGGSPLTAALRRLPAVDAGLLTLTVFEGYSVTAAAEVLGLKEATARSRLSRARSRLRGELRPAPVPAAPIDVETPMRRQP